MKSLKMAVCLVALGAAALFAAPKAEAHGGGVFVRDAFGNTVFVPAGGVVVSSRGFVPHHVVGRGVVVRGNVSQFNQDGGVNRIGRRR